jgi:hypothetical protein
MGKKRISEKCYECGKRFSYLPRTDGKPQRVLCYKCQPKKR